MSWVDKLSEREVRLVHEALLATTHGPWISRREFSTRTGVTHVDAVNIAAAWPVTQVPEHAARVVRAALVEVAFGIRVADHEWSQWFSESRESYELLVARLDALGSSDP